MVWSRPHKAVTTSVSFILRQKSLSGPVVKVKHSSHQAHYPVLCVCRLKSSLTDPHSLLHGLWSVLNNSPEPLHIDYSPHQGGFPFLGGSGRLALGRQALAGAHAQRALRRRQRWHPPLLSVAAAAAAAAALAAATPLGRRCLPCSEFSAAICRQAVCAFKRMCNVPSAPHFPAPTGSVQAPVRMEGRSMAARNRASRLARIGQSAAKQFAHPPAEAGRQRAGASRRRFQGAFAESGLGRAGLNRLRARHTLRAAAACAAAATLALAGVALSRLERGSAAEAVALALSAALLAALAFALRPAHKKRRAGKRRRGGAKRHADRPPSSAARRGVAKRRADRPPLGTAQRGGAKRHADRPPSGTARRSGAKRHAERPPLGTAQSGGANQHADRPPSGAARRGSAPRAAAPMGDQPADSRHPVEDGKPTKPDGASRKARNGCGRTFLRDRRGRFVSARSPLARIANRRAFGKACHNMRNAFFAKRISLGAATQNERGADGAGRHGRETRSAGTEFERLCAGDQRHARTACAATAAAALAGAAAPLLAQASSTALAGLIFGPATAAMLAVALRSDWAAWQIGQERFAGLAEYVRMRWLGRSRRSPRTGKGCVGKAAHHKAGERKTSGA